jgi:translocation and assembly module TamB
VAWTATVLGLLTLGVLLGLLVIVHSPKFHAYVLRKVQEQASDSLGSQVQVGDFAVHLSGLSPSVDVYRVVIHGALPQFEPPLFQADATHLQVTVTSLLRRTWYVEDVRIEHPVVHVYSDRQGKTNIPASHEPKGQPSQTNIFDLGIRHFLLERGEVYYNDLKSEITADLQQLTFRSGFDVTQQRYSGTLSYHDGHVQLSNGRPVPHNLDARFSATPQEFVLESAALTTEHSRVSLVGKVQDYADPKIQAEYKGLLDADEFRRALKNSALPEGLLEFAGNLSYKNEPQQSFLKAAIASGEFRSAAVTVTNANARIHIRNVSGKYSMAKGNANVSDLRAQLLGGALTATLAIRDLAGTANSQLSAALHGLSLAEVQSTLAPASAGRAAVKGSLNATARATWTKAMQNLVAQSDATLNSRLQSTHGGASTPVSGVIHATYNGKSEQLSLDNSYIRAPQTSLTLNGTISHKSALQVNLQTAQLHDLESLAMAFRAPDAAPIGVYGRAAVAATVTGSTANPQINAQLTATNLRLRDSAWKSLRAEIVANPSQISVQNGQLEPANQGHIRFQAATRLTRWAYAESGPFSATLNASQISAADLAKVTGLNMPVTGNLSVDVSAKGTQLAPVGQGTIRLTQAQISGEPIRSTVLQVIANGRRLNGNLQLDLPKAGSGKATFEYEPSKQAYQVDVRAVGMKLDELETFKAHNLPVSGVLNITANGQGSLRDPQLQALIEAPEIHVRDQVIRGLKLQSNVSNHVANFTLGSQVLEASIRGRGTIQLTGDYVSDVSLDTQTIPLAPVLAAYAPSQAANLKGQTELHATLKGPLKQKDRLEAHLTVPQLALNYKDTIQLGAASPIHADYVNGVLNLQRTVIRGTSTEVTLQARVPSAKDAPISLLVHGGIDLRLAQLISPDITSGGQLQFDIDSFGSRADPNVQGQIRIVNASFATVDTPLGLQAGNGVLTLTRDRLNVTQFQGKMGGGDVTARGGIIYRPALRFDLALSGKGVRVLYAQSVRSSMSSNLALTGNFDDAVLQGQVGIEELSFTPDFDLMELMSQFGGEATPPPSQGFTQNLRLEVGVSTPGGLNLTSRTLSLSGNANLQIRGNAAQPVLLGRMNLGSGDLIFSGNRYVLQGGTIDFRNPSRTEPVLDMAATTTINQYNIQLRFWGPADHLHTNYASDPTLPPADIINLIAFGKTSEAAAANPTPPGSLGAQSLVASQVSSQVTSRIEKLAGISQLSIDPVLGDSQQSAGARVAIQQRVTSKVFITFSTDVTGTQRQIIKMEYRASNRTSFDAVRDQNGGFSFQTSLRKQW